MTKKLNAGIVKLPFFRILSVPNTLPLVAFCVKPLVDPNTDREIACAWDEFELSDKLRERGWMIPACALTDPPDTYCNAQNQQLLFHCLIPACC